jgi:N-methylhydantoinase A
MIERRSPLEQRMNIVGIDIGGTFTDLVGCIEGRIVTSKASTVPADPTQALPIHLRSRIATWHLAEVLHGTTVAINTVLERKARGHADHHQGLPRCGATAGNRIDNLFFHRPQTLGRTQSDL